MSCFLRKLTHEFIISTEDEAIAKIQQFKDESLTQGYTVTKSGYVMKNKKVKGEVVDSWAVVTVQQAFDEE